MTILVKYVLPTLIQDYYCNYLVKAVRYLVVDEILTWFGFT